MEFFDLYSSYRIHILLFVFAFILLYKRKPKKQVKTQLITIPTDAKSTNAVVPVAVKIFYATTTHTTRDMAQLLKTKIPDSKVINLANYDVDQFLKEESICLFVLATWSDGMPPESAKWFSEWLNDVVNDFRVSKSFKLRYSVFALGDSEYRENYCKFGRLVDKDLKKMGATRMTPLKCGDRNNEMEKTFDQWSNFVVKSLDKVQDEAVDVDYYSDDDQEADVLDLEEIGVVLKEGSEKKIQKVSPMVTPMLRKSLTKQGYKIIGSHSGVKICRWTKSQLRGNGGCYKHTFYNISSHLCMETTPSLACANKCTFCWRHHSNPVGTSWRWEMNEPKEILDGAIEQHLKMINMLKGMPGVVPERFEEAKRVRHCALSLVGEPIMYPKINEFLTLLHAQQISSFLVTNCQFPDAIRDLQPVTQLYVSIDASTKETLKEVDRPLFGDFWERFMESLKYLRDKGQRTVYRLTLVKECNMTEINEYVDLIKIGEPDFIEIKGVTFCGSSEASSLTMKNVPYHVEVVRFCTTIVKAYNAKYGDTYEIASEHEHSCCVLISNLRFKRQGKWHTWIDFDKFHKLLASGASFSSTDYAQETPSWAVYGSNEKGFDPVETRVYRKSKNKNK